jgi:predicted nucleic acid-binding protein
VLSHAAARWNLVPIGAEVVGRARRPFPAEPLRALDAIHLASALLTAADVPELTVLSFDRRIRKAAQELGLTRTPA